MCGICGIVGLSQAGTEKLADAHMKRMLARLTHRGPDHAGAMRWPNALLGCTRLAIVDLNPRANQPMVTEDGRFAIVFNGEIYNHAHLRRQLLREGECFRTQSDTEVLLKLFARHGPRSLGELRGMFAFALWDEHEQELFLARDRMGEKPLVYAWTNGCLAFASEIGALLELPWIAREPDLVGLHYGLHYVTVPPPYTAFKHLHKLPPAHHLRVSRSGLSVQRYWQPVARPGEYLKCAGEAREAFNVTLDEAVSSLSRADVPVGAMLSGGLDSSAVVASLAAQETTARTFCVSQPGPHSEFAAARSVARHCGTEHREVLCSATSLEQVPSVIESYGEPLTSFVPIHAQAVAAAMHGRVKVALTGNGGDELFGGYAIHGLLQQEDSTTRFWQRAERYGVAALLGRLPVLERSRCRHAALSQVGIHAWLADSHTSGSRDFWEPLYSASGRELQSAHDPSLLLRAALESCGATSLFDSFLCAQLMLISQHSLVDIPDASSMRASIEYRSPFLDVKMVELGLRIPPHLKVRRAAGDRGGKWIMRAALRNRLPPDITTMPKRGFGSTIPYEQWMCSDWQGFVLAKLQSPALRQLGLLDCDALVHAYTAAQMGLRLPLELIWGAVMVAQWAEMYL